MDNDCLEIYEKDFLKKRLNLAKVFGDKDSVTTFDILLCLFNLFLTILLIYLY